MGSVTGYPPIRPRLKLWALREAPLYHPSVPNEKNIVEIKCIYRHIRRRQIQSAIWRDPVPIVES